MSDADHVSESKVSGNQANIPAWIRRELDIDDGDHLRWVYTGDGELRVEVVHRQEGTFREFAGYEGAETDVVADHDAFGVEEPADRDVPDRGE